MTEKGYRIANEVNKEGWEKSAFPLLCETCLGDNPYVRMQKEDYGVECKICVRPFTIFRWKAGTKGRYKATVICQSCAKVKNVCQTCLFDLEYGLPVQVRDKFLEEQGQSKISLPNSRVGRDYALAEAQKDKDGNDLPYGKVEAHPMLKRLARMTPYYKRNEARICTFYVKGQCNRGQDCPFRHELPEGGELANQKLRDRFHGENDPVAAKLLRRANEDMTLKPPEDKSITTMYIGGLESGVTDRDVRDKFYVFGEIRSIKVVPKQSCAFVTFVKREDAEEAATKLYRNLELKGKRANVMWGRPQQTAQQAASAAIVAGGAPPAEGAPGAASSSSTYRPYYPSMDPSAQGNAPLEGDAGPAG
jgi:pre-mRNA-splicing factor RBM22/SLT11